MGGRWAAPDAGCTGHRSSWVGSVPSGCRAPAPRAGGPGALRAHFPPSRRERSPRLRAGVQPPTCCFGGQGPDGGRGVAPAGSVLSTPGKNARGRKKLNPLQCLRGAKGRTSVCGDANPRGERGAGERVRDQAGRWGPRQRQCGRSLAQRGLPLTLRGADVLPQHFSSYPVNKGIRRSQLTCEMPAGSRPPPAAEGSITPCSHRWSWQAQPWSGCDDLSWEAQRPPPFLGAAEQWPERDRASSHQPPCAVGSNGDSPCSPGCGHHGLHERAPRNPHQCQGGHSFFEPQHCPPSRTPGQSSRTGQGTQRRAGHGVAHGDKSGGPGHKPQPPLAHSAGSAARQCCSSGTKSLSSRGMVQWKEQGDHEH